MCDCIGQTDHLLAGTNTALDVQLLWRPMRKMMDLRTRIVTMKRNPQLRGAKHKPLRLVATYCPFCGERYPEDAHESAEETADA